jgi:predicted Zn-dependent protease
MFFRSLRIKKTAILSLLLLFSVAGCESAQMVYGLDDSKMNEMGTDAFNKIKAETPIETNPAINNYVKCVAHALLAVHKDDTGVSSWEIVVFRSAEVNAFALPGGKIGVYTGLLGVATTQEQLAAVLGHEIAHVAKRHGKQRVQQQVIASGGLQVLQGIIGENPALMAAVGAGAQYGVLLPFSRAHESEADLVGLDLMARAGFNPQGAVQLWQNMSKAGGSKAPELLSTHPSGETRIRDLNAKMPKATATYLAARQAGRSPACR